MNNPSSMVRHTVSRQAVRAVASALVLACVACTPNGAGSGSTGSGGASVATGGRGGNVGGGGEGPSTGTGGASSTGGGGGSPAASGGGAGTGVVGSGGVGGGGRSGQAGAGQTGGSPATGGAAGGSALGGRGIAGSEGSGGRGGSGGSGAAGAGGGGAVPADGGVSTDGGDPVSPRPLNVTASKARHEHTFRARDADATVTFNDNTQIAVVDNRAATMMGKLVLPFGGVGENAGGLGASGQFCSRRGFHVLGIAAFQDYDILLGSADFYGDARKQVFEGVTYTRMGAFANINMTPADGVAQRTGKALQYLHAMFPTEDWGYFLNPDGSVRWSDVVFTGMSHGASNAARFAMLVRASRVVSISGPRDNMCTSLTAANCGGVVASWFSEVPKTPIDRFYALTGVMDDQHTQHLFAMQALKYTGTPVTVVGMQPPYGGSHRLRASAGHVDYCGEAAYRDACNYLYAVPAENQNGTP